LKKQEALAQASSLDSGVGGMSGGAASGGKPASHVSAEAVSQAKGTPYEVLECNGGEEVANLTSVELRVRKDLPKEKASNPPSATDNDNVVEEDITRGKTSPTMASKGGMGSVIMKVSKETSDESTTTHDALPRTTNAGRQEKNDKDARNSCEHSGRSAPLALRGDNVKGMDEVSDVVVAEIPDARKEHNDADAVRESYIGPSVLAEGRGTLPDDISEEIKPPICHDWNENDGENVENVPIRRHGSFKGTREVRHLPRTSATIGLGIDEEEEEVLHAEKLDLEDQTEAKLDAGRAKFVYENNEIVFTEVSSPTKVANDIMLHEIQLKEDDPLDNEEREVRKGKGGCAHEEVGFEVRTRDEGEKGEATGGPFEKDQIVFPLKGNRSSCPPSASEKANSVSREVIYVGNPDAAKASPEEEEGEERVIAGDEVDPSGEHDEGDKGRVGRRENGERRIRVAGRSKSLSPKMDEDVAETAAGQEDMKEEKCQGLDNEARAGDVSSIRLTRAECTTPLSRKEAFSSPTERDVKGSTTNDLGRN